MERMTNNFTAIDVETANADMASICQIGIAKYVDGRLDEEWSSLVNPEDFFDDINISIHGITESHVANSPTFDKVADIVSKFLNNTISVSHGHFDRVSINRAIDKYELPSLQTTWLNSARVARRTWKEFAIRGYGLGNICNNIGYDFKHHNALEDAKACAQVLLTAIDKTGLDVDAWLERVLKPIDPSKVRKPSKRTVIAEPITREGNTEGVLYGERIVFTGTLDIPRREAADLAASVGCAVDSRVTQKTNLLVVGDQDVQRLAGKNKSRKHLRAEQLIQQKHEIRILKESDFKKLVDEAQQSI